MIFSEKENKLIDGRLEVVCKAVSNASSGKSLILMAILIKSNCLIGCGKRVAAPLVVKDTLIEHVVPVFRRGIRVMPKAYVVQRGDSIYGIAWRFGVDYRDLLEWNRISNKNLIYEEQRLVMMPSRGNNRSTVKGGATRPLITSKKKIGDSGVEWAWPAKGEKRYVSENSKTSGVEILGQSGSPIRSAAAGVVAYSGNGLKGYGELIIVKHNNSYLSAYAHAQKRLVKEGDSVGSKEVIGLMGTTDSPKTMLYFEVRKNGKAVNPKLYLPAIN